MLISIVIPCYYSEKTIHKVVDMVRDEFNKNEGYECEFVLVNDGSTDGTFDEIRKLSQEYTNVKGINLMKNFGQHNALMAALQYTEGDYVLGMDDDMQTHPSQIFKLVHRIEEGFDLVYGIYPEVKNGPIKNLTSKINRKTSRVLLGRPKEIESSNFWIITRAIRDEVVKFDTFNPYIDAIFYRATSNIGMVPVEHFKREYGHSGYTFRKLLKLWMAYWNFSAVPLRMSFYVGTFSLLAGVLFAVYLIINKILSPDLPVGWSSMMCIMALLFGVVLMVLGVVGEYLGKIILILNNTPQFVVRETVGLEDKK
jgi:undecaprenyl-phosphate 4-deoxy-4-formamido-L-arabinose transferase